MQTNIKNMLLALWRVNLLRHPQGRYFLQFYYSMVKKCKYCTDIMENKFNKDLVMTKKDKDF